MYDFGIHLRPVLMERRLERCQNDAQLWRVTRFWRQYHKARRHLWVSNSWHFLCIQDSKQARPAQCNLQWWRLLFIQQQGRKRPNNVWSWGAAELHVERRLERCQNDVQLWRAARVWRQHHKTRRHLWVSNYRHYILHIQDSKQARSAQCNLLGSTLERQGSKPERPGSPTREEAPKLCLVLRGGWAACGTTSGTTSKRRPAVKSSPCLETAPQDPAALVGQQLQALYIAHSRQQTSTLSTVQSAGQHAGTPGPLTGLFFLYFRRKRPNYVWSWGPAELHVERRLDWHQGAGTLAHGNRQHHNAERASILAKKQQHECSCTWKQ